MDGHNLDQNNWEIFFCNLYTLFCVHDVSFTSLWIDFKECSGFLLHFGFRVFNEGCFVVMNNVST